MPILLLRFCGSVSRRSGSRCRCRYRSRSRCRYRSRSRYRYRCCYRSRCRCCSRSRCRCRYRSCSRYRYRRCYRCRYRSCSRYRYRRCYRCRSSRTFPLFHFLSGSVPARSPLFIVTPFLCLRCLEFLQLGRDFRGIGPLLRQRPLNPQTVPLKEAPDGVCRQRAVLEPVEHTRVVCRDEHGILPRFVPTDDFQELAVPCRPGIGGNDLVHRHFLLPDPAQPQTYCH